MSQLISDPPCAFDVHQLDFDTRLFGARLGSVSRTGAASASDLRHALQRARSEGFEHLIFRTGADDSQSIWAAEGAGMRLVDIGVDSTFSFASTQVPELPASPTVRHARTEDMPALQDLAATAFVRSRFVVDPFFDAEANVKLHREWVRNLFGGLAQAIFVCEIDGHVAGFVSNSVNEHEARIPLIATNSSYRRMGIGKALIAQALHWSQQQDVPHAHVKTQAHNYPALALYHRSGYVVSKTELTFSVTLNPQHGDQQHV